MRLEIATAVKANFLAAQANGAGVNVDVPIPGSVGSTFGNARCIIRDIILIAEENLSWELWLWSSATHPTNRDNDPWLGRWTFAAADAVTETSDPSTSYRYFIPDLNIPYWDDDTDVQTVEGAQGAGADRFTGLTRKTANGSIHMTLIPRGAAHVINKEVVIKFACEPWALQR
jgi:hypothetical protein